MMQREQASKARSFRTIPCRQLRTYSLKFVLLGRSSTFFGAIIGLSKTCVCLSHSVVSASLRPHGLYPARFLCPWNFPGKNTGVGSHSLLQEIFLTQGLNSGLLYCRQNLYHLSRQGNPKQKLSNT